MGSPTAWAVRAYDGRPCFRSGGETTSEVGNSRQRHGLENGVGSEALTGEGCRAGRAEEQWQLRAPFGVPVWRARRRQSRGSGIER
jgi:hypothetical protein